MIDMSQGQILDFGKKKEEEQKVLTNLKQAIQHLKDVAASHAQALMDLKAEAELFQKENTRLKNVLIMITYPMHQQKTFKEWAESFQQMALDGLAGQEPSRLIIDVQSK